MYLNLVVSNSLKLGAVDVTIFLFFYYKVPATFSHR